MKLVRQECTFERISTQGLFSVFLYLYPLMDTEHYWSIHLFRWIQPSIKARIPTLLWKVKVLQKLWKVVAKKILSMSYQHFSNQPNKSISVHTINMNFYDSYLIWDNSENSLWTALITIQPTILQLLSKDFKAIYKPGEIKPFESLLIFVICIFCTGKVW